VNSGSPKYRQAQARRRKSVRPLLTLSLID
jgi:hypothetical protein